MSRRSTRSAQESVHRRGGRRAAWVSAVAGTALVVIGCGGGGGGGGGDAGSPAQGRSNGPLRVLAAQAPADLDPANLVDIPSSVLGNMYVQLTRYGSEPNTDGTLRVDQAKVEPYLATRWKSSKDIRTWTFTLKPGLKFPSGRAVDASAVKYSLQAALKGLSASYIENGFTGNVVGIDAPSPTKVVIHLRKPDPNTPQVLALPGASIVDPSVVRGKPKKWLSSHEAGSGPYEMVAYEPNRSMTLRERKGFAAWNGRPPSVKEVQIDYVTDDSAMLLRVRSGDADVAMGLSKQSAGSLEGRSGLRVIASTTSNAEQVLLPWRQKPWNDVRVRQAAALAVPYAGIVQNVAKGFARPFFGPLNPGMGMYDAAHSKPLATSIEEAKRLIAESGMKTPIPVKLTIDQGNPVHEQIATLLQAAWKPIGIAVHVDPQPAAAYNDGIFSGKVQAALRLDGPAIIEPGYFLGYDMACGQNPGDICIRQADQLLDTSRASPDRAANQQRYDQITDLWRAQYPKIWLYNDRELTVLSKAVKQWRWATSVSFDDWAK